jgi:long-chain acyl-CoA synthetase
MLSYLPLSHVAERTLVEHGMLATGMHVFFAESLDTFTADLQRARPDGVLLGAAAVGEVPAGRRRQDAAGQAGPAAEDPHPARHRAQEDPHRAGPAGASFAAGGAAPMPPELLRWYNKLGLDLVEVYGMTENCGVSHATLPGKQRPGTVGLPYDGVQCRLDPANGEIQMKAPCLMLGYYKEPELTARPSPPTAG